MKVGDLVQIKCINQFLNKKIGTIVLYKKIEGIVYGLCVLIGEQVFGFEENEVEVISETIN